MAGWANVPAGKNKYDRLTRGGVTKYWSPGPLGLGGSYQTAATLNAQRQKEGLKPIDFTKIGVPKSTPTPAPTQTFQNTGGYGKYTPPSTQVKTPAQRTPAPAPAQRTLAPAPAQRTPTPAPTPFGRTMPAPAAASLDKYKINKDWAAANPRLAQAQVARASGQPRADINKILYKPGTAAYGAAGKSEMERQAKELKDKREEIAKQREADKIGPRAQSALPGGAYSPAATSKMTQRTRNILGVKEQYDAYDLVLEYLLSNGHADTLDEAHYVMMQMDGEYIQNIVEVSGELFRGIFNPNNSAASKAQKTSPFNRPVTPLPSITSPFARPSSRDDSGKLTPYGAGGGTAAEKGGKSRAEVMKQGAKNLENKNKPQANPGPDFGR